MADPRFLLIRLGSMGDIIHALPAASALRDTFPGARIDWAVEQKWLRLLEGNPDISESDFRGSQKRRRHFRHVSKAPRRAV